MANRQLLAGLLCALLVILASCDRGRQSSPGPAHESRESMETAARTPQRATARFDELRNIIRSGLATLPDVEEALTERNPLGLVNTINLLYLMRADLEIVEVLRAVWRRDRKRFPDLDWQLLEQPSVKVATAFTLARMQTFGSGPYVRYIRERLSDTDDFVQAQAAIALGFVGADKDISALTRLAVSGSAYASDSAIKALAVRGSEKAVRALLELDQSLAHDPVKQEVVRRMLTVHFPQALTGLHPVQPGSPAAASPEASQPSQ